MSVLEDAARDTLLALLADVTNNDSYSDDEGTARLIEVVNNVYQAERYESRMERLDAERRALDAKENAEDE